MEWRALSSGGSIGSIIGGSGAGYEEESGRGVVGRDMKRHMAVYSCDWDCVMEGAGDGGSLLGVSCGGVETEADLSRESSVLKLVATEASSLDEELDEEAVSGDELDEEAFSGDDESERCGRV